MTTPERQRKDTLAEVQHMLAHARPDQLRRLLDDIRAVRTITERDEDGSPQRRSA